MRNPSHAACRGDLPDGHQSELLMVADIYDTDFHLEADAVAERLQALINVFLDFLPPKFTLLRIVSGLEAPGRGRVKRQFLARFSNRTWYLSEPLRRQ